MQNKLNVTGFLFFLMLPQSGIAQINFSFSDYFDQFYNNYYLVNTANSDTAYKVSATVSNKTQTGLFQGVNKLYLELDFRKPSGKQAHHFFGIQAINNREGEFISKNKFNARYSWRSKISQRSSLSAGISVGFVNYAFNTSQSGAGGSAWAPDASTGIWYLRPKLSLGISMQQIFNQKIRPANQIFYLNNYYTITANYLIPINYFLTLNTHFYTKFQTQQPIYFAVASLFEIREIFSPGIGYSYHRGFSPVIGLKRIGIGNSYFSFYFSYFVGASKINNVSDNAFELLLKYQL